jgi:hypothetical protein
MRSKNQNPEDENNYGEYAACAKKHQRSKAAVGDPAAAAFTQIIANSRGSAAVWRRISGYQKVGRE